MNRILVAVLVISATKAMTEARNTDKKVQTCFEPMMECATRLANCSSSTDIKCRCEKVDEWFDQCQKEKELNDCKNDDVLKDLRQMVNETCLLGSANETDANNTRYYDREPPGDEAISSSSSLLPSIASLASITGMFYLLT